MNYIGFVNDKCLPYVTKCNDYDQPYIMYLFPEIYNNISPIAWWSNSNGLRLGFDKDLVTLTKSFVCLERQFLALGMTFGEQTGKMTFLYKQL